MLMDHMVTPVGKQACTSTPQTKRPHPPPPPPKPSPSPLFTAPVVGVLVLVGISALVGWSRKSDGQRTGQTLAQKMLRRLFLADNKQTAPPPPPPLLSTADVSSSSTTTAAPAKANTVTNGSDSGSMWGDARSLYDINAHTQLRNGDPVADKYCGAVWGRVAWMAVADGVNWGPKAAQAAQSAVEGATDSITAFLRSTTTTSAASPMTTTQAAVEAALDAAVRDAHDRVICENGTMTTFVAALYLPFAAESPNGAGLLTCVRVGDSEAFHFNGQSGLVKTVVVDEGVLRESLKFTPGALGYAQGEEPDLGNKRTVSIAVRPGDVVVLCSDGIADNLDPEVRRAIPVIDLPSKGDADVDAHKTERAVVKRYLSCLHLANVIGPLRKEGAQAIGQAILDDADKLTQQHRSLVEAANLHEPCPEGVDPADHQKTLKRRDDELYAKVLAIPGKLDHASVLVLKL